MPWKVVKSGSKYNVVKSDTGKVVDTYGSSNEAASRVRALYANYNSPERKAKVRKVRKRAMKASPAFRAAAKKRGY